MAKLLTFLLAFGLGLSSLTVEARQIVDIYGRVLEVPEKVTRLVALGGGMGFVTYLQAQGLVVGVEGGY